MCDRAAERREFRAQWLYVNELVIVGGVGKLVDLRLGDFERYLSRHEGPFFFGDQPYYCDFGVFHHVDLAHFFDADLLADYPRVSAMMEAIRGISGVAAYLDQRPELIGVGTKPQLVIDGTPEATGVAKG